MVWIWIWVWGNEIGFGKMKMVLSLGKWNWIWENENGFAFGEMESTGEMETIMSLEKWNRMVNWKWFEFGEMESNGEFKTNECDNLIMLNDFNIVDLSFALTWTIAMWVRELWFQKFQNITDWESDWVNMYYYDDWW